MTKEEKQLLIKALCEMLPYGVICTDLRHGDSRVFRVDINPSYPISKEEYAEVYYWDFDEWGFIENCKPYLRPMESMKEEEIKKFRENFDFEEREAYEVRANGENKIVILQADCDLSATELDWLNAHHFDYRGLIEKGLALEAPDGMYKIE